MFLTEATVIDHLEIASGYYRMILETPKISCQAYPGQFIHTRISDQYDPLLRRPFSIHRIDRKRGRIEILYRVVGKGTHLLTKARPGYKLDVFGPLGNGFKVDRYLKTAIIIAGGIGVAPLLTLGEELVKRGVSTRVFIGAKTRGLILCENEFKELGCEVRVSTEDGSSGYFGTVTDMFRDFLLSNEDISGSSPSLFACGPYSMFREVALLTRRFNIYCQVSLEERMACGVGVCLGCAVRVKGGVYKRVCKDGPVFSAEEVAWNDNSQAYC
ncbi:MAG: dihydroorotate dehydrogenase electron transfer subunit [bacterium]|nr:dihydroorotate dehydrogenase electron transfer subunit [bacterium]